MPSLAFSMKTFSACGIFKLVDDSSQDKTFNHLINRARLLTELSTCEAVLEAYSSGQKKLEKDTSSTIDGEKNTPVTAATLLSVTKKSDSRFSKFQLFVNLSR